MRAELAKAPTPTFFCRLFGHDVIYFLAKSIVPGSADAGELWSAPCATICVDRVMMETARLETGSR